MKQSDPNIMTAKSVLKVSELTALIKHTLEPEYTNLWIEGEISNLKIPSSGHFYFTLKDKTSQIRAVMFRFKNKSLKYSPENGMKVVCKAGLNVYEPRGEYQLLVESMTPSGIGDLHFAFEQLKKKLGQEGLFDSQHKKPLPFLPDKIAVITSPSGAAVRDIINIIRRRFSGIQVLVTPVKVQGDRAASEIEEAIKLINRLKKAEVIILGRGGGSIEDLWAFNEEKVARAIFNSEIPIISAVGHETDFTISDFTADLRAPTPSAAAEMVVLEKDKLAKQLSQTISQLNSVLIRKIEKNRIRIDSCRRSLLDRIKKLSDLRLKTDDLNIRLTQTIDHILSLKKSEIKGLQRHILSSPPSNIINHKRERMKHLRENIFRYFTILKNSKNSSLGTCAARLNTLNPLQTLERGYSITRVLPAMNTVSKAQDLEIGDRLNIRFSKGSADCEVTKISG